MQTLFRSARSVRDTGVTTTHTDPSERPNPASPKLWSKVLRFPEFLRDKWKAANCQSPNNTMLSLFCSFRLYLSLSAPSVPKACQLEAQARHPNADAGSLEVPWTLAFCMLREAATLHAGLRPTSTVMVATVGKLRGLKSRRDVP